jgi:hypothetical protein
VLIKILFNKKEIADALNLIGGVFGNGSFKEVPLTEVPYPVNDFI